MNKIRPRRAEADSGTKIRRARKGDLPALLEIYNREVRNSPATFDLEPQTLAQRKRWFSTHRRLHPLVVAEGHGRVIGYASLSRFRDKPGYSRTGEDSVYVRRGCQGKGVGTRLLKEILSRAAKLGYHTIIAGVVPPNEASVRLHERLGFRYVGSFREVGLKLAQWQDVALYQAFLPVKAVRG